MPAFSAGVQRHAGNTNAIRKYNQALYTHLNTSIVPGTMNTFQRRGPSSGLAVMTYVLLMTEENDSDLGSVNFSFLSAVALR